MWCYVEKIFAAFPLVHRPEPWIKDDFQWRYSLLKGKHKNILNQRGEWLGTGERSVLCCLLQGLKCQDPPLQSRLPRHVCPMILHGCTVAQDAVPILLGSDKIWVHVLGSFLIHKITLDKSFNICEPQFLQSEMRIVYLLPFYNRFIVRENMKSHNLFKRYNFIYNANVIYFASQADF